MTISVSITKSELLRDIDRTTHAYAKAIDSQDMKKADAVESDTGDANSLALLGRFLDRRMSELKTLLLRFLQRSSINSISDASPEGGYNFSLVFPEDADGASINNLPALMHDYLVKGALSDWYKSLGLSALSEQLLVEAASDFQNIRTNIYYRPMP